MPCVIKSFFRTVADLLSHESGELLSTHRKSHLLEQQMYARLDRKHARMTRTKIWAIRIRCAAGKPSPAAPPTPPLPGG